MFLKSIRVRKLLSVSEEDRGGIGSYVHALSVRSAGRVVGVEGSAVDEESC